MSPFEVYRKYCAIKAHFSYSSYDYIKLNGAIKLTFASFDKRSDKFFFSCISKKLRSADVVPFFVAQFIDSNDKWIGDMSSEFMKSMQIYRKWLGEFSSITQGINEDISYIKEFLEEHKLQPEQLFEIQDQTHPLILRFFLEKMIRIETMIHLEKRYHFIETLDQELIDPIWEFYSNQIKKYSSFLHKFNFDKCESL